MLKAILLLAAGCGLTANACAQAPTAPLPSDLSTARYDRSDTLRAVKHLFIQRSRATRGVLQVGASTVATAAVEKVALASSDMKKRDKSFYETRQQETNGDLLIGGLATTYGLFRLSRFGPHQYQRVTEAYEQGAPLPPYLTRKLKTKYFRLEPL
ncbi:hypothetical protein K3G63_05580 [Hymenobacter sp. HSC-4F20]|uniref:hypothetical protein n=1 Tax=Hymenobacter sp. HSC-4F20 TaxID=2864135 RepID=UPI001C72FB20|nr:hypothetical protein [Hymenobacter sp. HSC-4F20]MBX0289899.1 hypothetical protein [Hymenobacter sp. HSC-4F20]